MEWIKVRLSDTVAPQAAFKMLIKLKQHALFSQLKHSWQNLILVTFCCFRTDGSFAVNDVPSGSYVVEVVSPNYRFEPVRVDITSKGKMR